jgi:hypothetical protein
MADLLDSTGEWLAAQAGLDDEGRTVSSEFIGTAGIVGAENAEKRLAEMGAVFTACTSSGLTVVDKAVFDHPSKPATCRLVRSARRLQLGSEFGLNA